MREFVKSVTGTSWALSLFGVKQTLNLLTPARQGQAFKETEAVLEDISRSAREHLGPDFAKLLESGDEFQRRVVDSTFGAIEAIGLNPERVIQSGGDLFQRATSIFAAAPSKN